MEKLDPFKFKVFREIYDLADYCNKIVDRQDRIVEAIKLISKVSIDVGTENKINEILNE